VSGPVASARDAVAGKAQPDLFGASNVCHRYVCVALSRPPAEVAYYPNFLSRSGADGYFAALRASIAWREEEVMMYGRMVRVPRLTAWYGDREAFYTYSFARHRPQPWTAVLRELRAAVESFTGDRFNSVLLNLYRSGRDSVAWHADDERELGPRPAIASVSLGTPRTFAMRARDRSKAFSIVLEHGSLLLMRGDSQRCYQHAVPKEPRIAGERINLTFRTIRKEERAAAPRFGQTKV
jgi:alkylated DNA repair dioxygenase AlkB